MKITIDTKEDSKEEIKKVISLLQNMLDEPRSNIFDDKTQPGIFGMFNDKSESSENKAIVTDDLLKGTGNTEEKEKKEKGIEAEEEEKFEIETY